ncbi:MAG TPA: SdrD B-like domain-containing protein, partial [Humisphaera sp.]|nr:SdrD B-like domain-containing protein [Humisphaera sp.]
MKSRCALRPKRAGLAIRFAGQFHIQVLEQRSLLSAGALIDTFGDHGIASVAGDAVAAVAQPDGKIVTIGAGGSLRRFNTDGSLDQNFGTNGVVHMSLPPVPQETAEFDDVALQKNGSIVVAGALNYDFGNGNSGTSVTMFRFTASGALDSSLNNGQGFVNPISSFGVAKSVQVQSDGKILLGGVYISSNAAFIVRVNANGTADNTFGFGGLASLPGTKTIGGMALDSNSDIIVDGLGFNSQPMVMRLLPTGFGDLFGNGGATPIASTNFGRPIVRPDNSILIPLVSGNGFTNSLEAEAFTSNGDVNTSFGTNGIASANVGFIDSSNPIYGALQPNGMIDLAAGGATGAGNDIVVARFNDQGAADTTFGSNGATTAAFPDPVAVASLVYTSNGRITAVGNSNGSIVLAAFDASTPTGSISGTVFNDANGDNVRQGAEPGLSGRTVFLDANQNGTLDAGEKSIVTDSTGHYLFANLPVGQYKLQDVQPAGWKAPINFDQTVVAPSQTTVFNFASSKIDATMPFDAAFGTGGVVRNSFFTGQGVARQADGKLLVIAQDRLGRYTVAGALDKSFGVNGWMANPIPQSNLGAIAIQSDGKIVLAADKPLTPSGSIWGTVVGRLNSDGSIDKTYGTGGVASTSFANVNGFPELIVRPDNSAIVTSSFFGPAPSFALARITPTGQVDATFGTGGYVALSFAQTTIQGAALAPNNAILLAGSAFDNQKTDGLVMRLTADGKVDTSFGTAGKVLTAASAPVMWSALTVTADGKVIAAGVDNSHLAAARFNSDGSVDSTFGTSGLAVVSTPVTTTSSGGSDAVVFVGKTSDGGYVIAGSIGHTAYEQSDFTAALFTASGKLDTRFGHAGEAWAGISDGSDFATSALLQPDGKLVMAGFINGPGQAAVVRFNLPTTAPLAATISGTIYTDNNGNAKRDTG